MRALVGGWTVSAALRYQSGTPLQLFADNNLPLFNYTQRPNRVAGEPSQTGISNGDFNPAVDRRINLQAFSAPLPFTFGNTAPTIGNLRQFPVLQEDVSLTKRFLVGERWRVELNGQAFNLFNRHRFTSIVTNYSSPSFGRAGGSSVGRYVQLGAKVTF